jgi:ligand-binding sensor domain-containing protein
MSQCIHDHWGPAEGFPAGQVFAISQTTDGYLWIATEAGLVRFDGLAFALTRSARSAQLQLPLDQSLGLAADDSGDLWIRLRGLNLLRYRDGAFFEAPPELDQLRAGVTVAARGGNGELIFATKRNGLYSLRQGKLEKLAAEPMPTSPVIALAKTPDGDVWMGTRDAGLARLRAGHVSSITAGLPDLKIDFLLADGTDTLWIGTSKGIVRWNGSQNTQDGVPPPLQRLETLAMIRDRDANIWVGAPGGLLRVNAKGVATFATKLSTKLSTKTGEAVTALFEDREGNLWAGGPGGIDRLRDSVFVTYSNAEGMPAENMGAVYAGERNRTWFAPESGGLYALAVGNAAGKVADGKITTVAAAGLDKDIVYSIAGRPGKSNAELWIGRQRGGLTHLVPHGESFIARTFTTAEGLAQNSVFAVTVGRDGTVWAGTLNSGVSRFRDGRFTTLTTADGLASNTIFSVLEGSGGDMWFATPSGLSSTRPAPGAVNGKDTPIVRSYTARDGLPSDNVNCLFEDSAGMLWIGTLDGLAFLRFGRIQVPAAPEPSLREQIFGIAEDSSGYLWITTPNHVLRVNRDRLLSAGRGEVREYELADGLHSLTGVKRHRSVMADPLGGIWLSMTRGLSVVDSARLAGPAIPAIVHIQALSADGSPIDFDRPVRVPPRPQRIALDYSGLSLAIPQRTRFRYILEGFDHGWSQPTPATEAAYTNLGPGPYRFRVIARNNNGVWNQTGDTLDFSIDPAYYQTNLFRAACAAAFLGTLWALHRRRLRQTAQEFNVRLEERVGERTRIARELHDTLLQSFQGLMLHLQAGIDLLPSGKTKEALDKAL